MIFLLNVGLTTNLQLFSQNASLKGHSHDPSWPGRDGSRIILMY